MNDLQIDLRGLEDKWSTSSERICVVCGFNFDTASFEDPDDDIPLLLWRKDGEEILVLCWKCAGGRMQRQDLN